MRIVLIVCLAVLLLGCATTAQERAGLHLLDAVLSVGVGLVTLDPFSAFWFVNSGLDVGAAAVECVGESCTPPTQQTAPSPDR